jgi:hypothetical protein
MAEHTWREIANVVCHNARRPGRDRRGDDVSILALAFRPANFLGGQYEVKRRLDLRGWESLVHFVASINDPFGRYAGHGMKVPHPLRMNPFGPNWLEYAGGGKVKQ